MVKDLRSEHETSDIAGVLDGDLDSFIEAYLLLSADRRAAANSGRSLVSARGQATE
jgi:peptide chain release factor 2